MVDRLDSDLIPQQVCSNSYAGANATPGAAGAQRCTGPRCSTLNRAPSSSSSPSPPHAALYKMVAKALFRAHVEGKLKAEIIQARGPAPRPADAHALGPALALPCWPGGQVSAQF